LANRALQYSALLHNMVFRYEIKNDLDKKLVVRCKYLLFNYLTLAYLLQVETKPEEETAELAHDIFILDPSQI
jgi:hypothetical protein